MKQIIFEEILDGIAIDRIVRDYEYTMPTKHFHNEYEIYYLKVNDIILLKNRLI